MTPAFFLNRLNILNPKEALVVFIPIQFEISDLFVTLAQFLLSLYSLCRRPPRLHPPRRACPRGDGGPAKTSKPCPCEGRDQNGSV